MNALHNTNLDALFKGVRFEFNQKEGEVTRDLSLLVNKNTGNIERVAPSMSFLEGCVNVQAKVKTSVEEKKHVVELVDTMSLLSEEAKEYLQHLVAEFNA